MRIAPTVAATAILTLGLTACTFAPPPSTPSPSMEQARLPLTNESTAPETAIPFDGADDVTELVLWLQLPSGGGWTGDAQVGTAAESTAAACRFEQSTVTIDSPAGGDRAASATRLDELVAGRVPLQDARRLAWGTGEAFVEGASFDLLATLVDDDGYSVVGARVFAKYGLEYRMELHCDELAELNGVLDEAADAVATIPRRDDVAQVVPGELVGPYTVHIPVDLGARDFAAGETVVDADGAPVAYLVAPGDVWDIVAKRYGLYGIPPTDQRVSSFNLDTGYLNVINQVRRGETPWKLYEGDIVNLSASTITSTGRINGETLAGAPPTPLPPQH